MTQTGGGRPNKVLSIGKASKKALGKRKRPFWILSIAVLVFLSVVSRWWFGSSLDNDSLFRISSRQGGSSVPIFGNVDNGERPHCTQEQLQQNGQDGLIVVNIVGRLGNDHFEVALARRLAEELCWSVVYRQHWQPGFLTPETDRCFPNALLPTPTDLSENLRTYLGIDRQLWQRLLVRTKRRAHTETIAKWADQLKQEGKAVMYHAGQREDLATSLRRHVGIIRQQQQQQHTSTGDGTNDAQPRIRLMVLQDFFIRTDLFDGNDNKHRSWLSVEPSCCLTPPPPREAVVIHIRHFTESSAQEYNYGFHFGVYQDVFRQYNLTNRPVWVVCEKTAGNTPLVGDLQTRLGATIMSGENPIDAHCILRRASVLFTSTTSTFSQSAAFFSESADDMDVHYLVPPNNRAVATLKVPGWKYHLVKRNKRSVREFDRPYTQVRSIV